MYSCPEQLNEHTCQWTTKSEPIYRITAERFLFKLVSNNSLGTTINYFNISHYDIIEPSVPQHFGYARLNATFVRLEWKPPEHFDYDFKLLQKLNYQMQIDRHLSSSSSSSRDSHPIERNVIDLAGRYSFDFNHLIPYSEYRFRLRCRVSNSNQSVYWSIPANLTLQTPSDIPYHCPAFYNSSFESSTTVTGDRSMTVYWKPVDAQFANGPNLQYRIEYGQVESLRLPRLTNQLAEIKIGNASVTFHTFEQMLTNVSYMFRIQSVNDIGPSECSSQLVIDKLINQPSKPMDLTVSYLGDGKYELKWKHSRPSQVKQFTVYWCPNVLPRPFPCVGVLNSKSILNHELAENANHHNFSYLLENLDDKLNYQFSIAAESGLSSSGISWASCIIPKQIEKLDKINDFRAVAISPYVIEISWKLQCSALSELIEKFEIAYCDVSDHDINKCESHRKVIVNGGDQEHVKVKGLQPNTLYRVSIRALTSNKASEENSAIVRTFDGPPAQPSHLIHQQSSSRSVTLHWALAVKPKESIHFFEIMYGDTVSVFDAQKVCTQSFTKSEIGPIVKTSYECSAKLMKNVRPNTLYHMQLKGCIMNNFMEIRRPICSPSTNITVKTDVEAPGITRKAYIKNVDKSHVLIEWPTPENPNGQIDHYKVRLFYRKDVHREWQVKGNMTRVDIDCSQYALSPTPGVSSNSGSAIKGDSPVNYPYVSVAAVNVKNGTLLIGPFSESSSVTLCERISPEMTLTALVGFTVSGAICILVSVFVLFIMFKWILKQINYIKKMSIDLPTGLKEPRLNFDDPPLPHSPPADANTVEKQGTLQLNRWNSLYLINADRGTETCAKVDDDADDAFGDLTRLLLWKNDGNYMEPQSIDQIDLKACIATDFELQGIRGSSHLSGSIESSLGAARSEESNLDEQKPFLAGNRENDINSSGSNDSGVDVQGPNGHFKAKSATLEPIHESKLLPADMSKQVLNNDLLVFQSLSSSVPSLYDGTNTATSNKSKRNSSHTTTKPIKQHYTNLYKEYPLKMESSDPVDIDLSALRLANDLIDFQNLSPLTTDNRNDPIPAPDVDFNFKNHSLSLLDLRDLKSDTIDCFKLVNQPPLLESLGNGHNSLDSFSTQTFDEDEHNDPDGDGDLNELNIDCTSPPKLSPAMTSHDYVAFAVKPLPVSSPSRSESASIEASELSFSSSAVAALVDQSKSLHSGNSPTMASDDVHGDSDTSSSIETNSTTIPIDQFLFDMNATCDLNLLPVSKPPSVVSLDSFACDLKQPPKPFTPNSIKSDYVPIYDLIK